jgi:glycosyltransferase involved in cell wall biosynthesis
LKILFTTQAYYPFLETGGPATKIRSIACRLGSRGHSLSIVTADLGLDHSQTPLKRTELYPWGTLSTEAEVQTYYFRSLAQYRALTVNPDVIRFLRVNLQDFPIAHIYGLYDLFGPTTALYCSRRKVPYILEPMGMMRPIVRNIGLKRLYQFVLGDRVVHNARYLVATSPQEKQEFLELGVNEDRIVIRRNGIEAPEEIPGPGAFRSAWNIPVEAKVVLFLGRVAQKKSPDLLIKAFGSWKKGPGVEVPAVLVIAGPEEDSPYSASLRELVTHLSLSQDVLFTGPIYGQQRWEAFRDADVFVLPSQNENFGNTVAESAACGTPVIVTDQCGIAPYVKGRSGAIIPHELGALEKALGEFLTHPNLRERFKEGCRSMTEMLDWNAPVDEMETLYQTCVREPLPQ